MHATERKSLILELLGQRGFVTFRELEQKIEGSPATIRRDLEGLALEGKLQRVRGGAKANGEPASANNLENLKLFGSSFEENIRQNLAAKRAIGKAAASLCAPGEGVTIDGGTTTLQMCPHLEGLGIQVLTNSLHIVLALINQAGTGVLMPGGAVFREQNIVLPVFGEDLTPQFHAPKLFMGAGAIGPQGLMQEDIVLVAGERRFIERADEVIVLADSSKFERPSGNVVCELGTLSLIITDEKVSDHAAQFIEQAGVTLTVVES